MIQSSGTSHLFNSTPPDFLFIFKLALLQAVYQYFYTLKRLHTAHMGSVSSQFPHKEKTRCKVCPRLSVCAWSIVIQSEYTQKCRAHFQTVFCLSIQTSNLWDCRQRMKQMSRFSFKQRIKKKRHTSSSVTVAMHADGEHRGAATMNEFRKHTRAVSAFHILYT